MPLIESPRSKVIRERVLIIVKALPHAGERHGETVCCAGITAEGEWRRQFPIRFRTFANEKKFKRWQWIEYDCLLPKGDKRPESRRVIEDTIKIVPPEMPISRRANFLRPIVVRSTDEAEMRGQTLALVEPLEVKFTHKRKTADELGEETEKYAQAVRQQSLFKFSDATITQYRPEPYLFRFSYTTADGKKHNSTCDDWETSAMFRNFSKRYGETQALEIMKKTFEEDYPQKGMVFAMGTHSLYPKLWLLVGVIRLDKASQFSLSL